MKKLSKVLALILALAMVLSLAACGGSNGGSEESSADAAPAASADAAAPAPAASGNAGSGSEADANLDYQSVSLEGLHIGYVTINGAAPWGGLIGTAFQEYAQEVGAKVDILDAQTDLDKVAEYCNQFIDAGVDALVIFGGDIEANATIAADAKAAGVPVFMAALDVAESGRDSVEAVVGPDQYQMCADIAQFIVDENGTDTDYQVLQISGVPFLEDYIQRDAGFADKMAEYSNYDLSAEIQFAYSSRSDAKDLTTTLLTANPDAQILMGYDDDLTMGAIQAIEEAGKSDQIKVYSLTGQKDAIQAVIDGKLELTVFNSARNISKGLVTAIAEYNSNGSVSAYYLRTPLEYITADNAADYLDVAEF